MGERIFFIARDGYEAAQGLESVVLQCGEEGTWDAPTPQFLPIQGDYLINKGRHLTITLILPTKHILKMI